MGADSLLLGVVVVVVRQLRFVVLASLVLLIVVGLLRYLELFSGVGASANGALLGDLGQVGGLLGQSIVFFIAGLLAVVVFLLLLDDELVASILLVLLELDLNLILILELACIIKTSQLLLTLVGCQLRVIAALRQNGRDGDATAQWIYFSVLNELVGDGLSVLTQLLLLLLIAPFN